MGFNVLNYIWFAMLVIGVVVGIMNGRVSEITQATMDSSQNAIQLGVGLWGNVPLDWNNEYCRKSGLIRKIADL